MIHSDAQSVVTEMVLRTIKRYGRERSLALLLKAYYLAESPDVVDPSEKLTWDDLTEGIDWDCVVRDAMEGSQ